MLKKTIIAIILYFSLALPTFAANLSDAFSTNNVGGVTGMALSANYKTGATSTPEYVVQIAISTTFSVLGIIFIILIIYAGISWMIAGGNEEKSAKAKRIITESIIGLAFVIGAYAISYFVTTYLFQ